MSQNFRLKITHGLSTYFLVRVDKKVRLFSRSGRPLAMNTLTSDRAAELEFEMEDAVGAVDAAMTVQRLLPNAEVEIYNTSGRFAHPMSRVRSYDRALTKLGLAPNGTDYEAVIELLNGGAYVAPTEEGR